MKVLAELAALPEKTTLELNQIWRNLFETDPPQAGKRYLVRRLAWRIQELAHGGFSESSETILDGLAKGEATPKQSNVRSDTAIPAPGARMIREWKGVEHVVMVLDDGFEYQNRKYRSLSGVAKAITGTHWSGPLFFGLRKGGKL
jgi:hypothetical protein